jgi:hypothetical protein
MNKEGFVIVRSVDDMKKYNAMGMDLDFNTVRFRANKNGKFIIINELEKIVKDKIKHYKKVIEKNDKEYIEIDDFALGLAGEKMSKYQKKKALDELQNGIIFVQGKVEAFQEILREIK